MGDAVVTAHMISARMQPGLWTMTVHGLETERQANAHIEVAGPEVTLVGPVSQ